MSNFTSTGFRIRFTNYLNASLHISLRRLYSASSPNRIIDSRITVSDPPDPSEFSEAVTSVEGPEAPSKVTTTVKSSFHPDKNTEKTNKTLKGNKLNIDTYLRKRTWSVRSLLPNPNQPPSKEITPQKLHHLLRLSALPQPKDLAEEASMLKILHDQLHFVKDIQTLDTEGVTPLQSIRDETEEGIKEVTIGLKELKAALAKEDLVGKVSRRPRRRKETVDGKGVEDWDVLGPAGEKINGPGGKFFVVRSGKSKEADA